MAEAETRKASSFSPPRRDMMISPPPTDANTVVSTAGPSRSVTGANTTTVENEASMSKDRRDRDRLGRYKLTSGGKKQRSAEQILKDKACSNVTKYKKIIVEHIRKIQSIRPDVSQTYMVESDTKNTLRNPVVCKTVGNSTTKRPGPSQVVESMDLVPAGTLEDEEVSDSPSPVAAGTGTEYEVDSEMPAPGALAPAPPPRGETNRLADKLCYVCKKQIGPVNSKRIGGSIKKRTL